jgi:hypothetical protein
MIDFKSDKFRKRAFIVIIIVFLIHLSAQQDKKEATQTFEICNSFNTKPLNTWCHALTIDDKTTTGCIDALPGVNVFNCDNCMICKSNGCFMANEKDVGLATDDRGVCVPCVPPGSYSEDSTYCCSGESIPYNDKMVLCKAPTPGEPSQVCNDAEKGFANILTKLKIDLGCKTNYYLVLVAGGFLALIALAMVL